MGWLVEQAGGAATKGKTARPDIQPTQRRARERDPGFEKRGRTRDRLPHNGI